MANLSTQQRDAILAGQPVRQVWAIKAPVVANHSAYTTTVIDDGIWPTASAPTRRVIKAGKRTHKVWNPHPMENRRPEAVRYSIEVANGDGYFHRKTGSPWNPFGIYDAAPAECFLLHNIYVLVPSSGTWTEITHMAYVGRILQVNYSGSSSMIRDGSSGSAVARGAPDVATIVSEQDGAWAVLRGAFDKSHGVETSNLFTFAVGGTALTTTSISPTTKASGSADFTLTVNGTGFSALNPAIILLDGEPLDTNYVSATQVTCDVLAAHVATAGTRSITAFRDGPAGSTSNAQTLTVT